MNKKYFNERMRKGYQVLIKYHNSNAYWGEDWIPLGNCWGYPYEYKGFAIKKARQFSTISMGKPFALVVEISTGEIVWESDNYKEANNAIQN